MFIYYSNAACKLPTRLGEIEKLKRGLKSKAQVESGVRNSVDVCWEWRRGGRFCQSGMGDREYLASTLYDTSND